MEKSLSDSKTIKKANENPEAAIKSRDTLLRNNYPKIGLEKWWPESYRFKIATVKLRNILKEKYCSSS